MYFINQEYPFSNKELYKSYKIKSLLIENYKKIMKISFEEKDLEIVIFLISEKI
jgi:hypothetical protein